MRFFYIPTKSFYLFLLMLMIGKLNFAQRSSSLTAALSPSATIEDPNATKEKLSDPATWTEDISKRTVYSSTYRTPEGQVVISNSSRPVNYYVNGTLKTIDPKLKTSAEGWSATDQPYPTYLFTDGSAAITVADNAKMIFGKNGEINGVKLKKELHC